MLALFFDEVKNILDYLPLSEYGLSWLGVVILSILIMMAVELFTENPHVFEEYTEEYGSLKATE